MYVYSFILCVYIGHDIREGRGKKAFLSRAKASSDRHVTSEQKEDYSGAGREDMEGRLGSGGVE